MDPSKDSEDKSAQDQMLIEKDGKYELVNASDVQIDVAQLQDTAYKLTDQNSPEKQQLPLTNSNVDDNVAIAEANALEKTVGEKKVLSAASTHALGREKRVNYLVGRTKSAPGLRGREKVEENREEQRKRNEAAFSAWLATKNEELVKRRQLERQECRMNEERLIQKQTLNEAAYRAWLEKKTTEQQIQRKNASRPATSVPQVDEARKQAAFEAWVDSKRDQYRKKIVAERQKHTHEAEKAKNADPTIVEQAYKNWLHRKSVQAKAEAQKKEQYRRAFFSESKRLHKSLSHRFEGF